MSEEKKQIRNPYLDGRQEWNERYGSYIEQAKNWRLAAMGSLVVAIIATSGVVYIGSQNKIKPYVVEVDKLGEAIAVGPIKQLSYNENVIKFGLADFITNFRTIYLNDPEIQKKHVTETFKYLADSLPAYQQIRDYYQQHNPLASQNFRQVTIESVLAVGKDLYQVDWIEKNYDKKGNLVLSENYRATINIVIETPKTEEQIIKNPVGLYIKDISFQKTMN